MQLDITEVAAEELSATETLFSESNTRFLLEITADNAAELESLFSNTKVKLLRLGTITDLGQVQVNCGGQETLSVDIQEAKQAWLSPLDW